MLRSISSSRRPAFRWRVVLPALVVGVCAAFAACGSSGDPAATCLSYCQRSAACGAPPDCASGCNQIVGEAEARGCSQELDTYLACAASLPNPCAGATACAVSKGVWEGCVHVPSTTVGPGATSSSGGVGGEIGAGGGSSGPTTTTSASSSGSSSSWRCTTESTYCYCDDATPMPDTSCTPGWSCCRWVPASGGDFCQCTNDEGAACDSAWAMWPNAQVVSNCPP